MKTKTFDVKITLTCVEEDMSGSWCEVHGDSVTAESIQNELRSWLGDLGFSVSFDNQSSIYYESKCQSILWEYISEKDFEEIQERLDNE